MLPNTMTPSTKADDNHHDEVEVLFEGSLVGVLPASREFEFKLSNGGQVLLGMVGPAVEDIDALNAMLHRPMNLRVMVTRVGQGRPRYLLLETPTPEPSAP